GNPTSDAAVRLGAELAKREEAHVTVLAVLEPLPVLDAGFSPAVVPYDSFDRRRAEELRTRVTAQVRNAAGHGCAWPIEIAPPPRVRRARPPGRHLASREGARPPRPRRPPVRRRDRAQGEPAESGARARGVARPRRAPASRARRDGLQRVELRGGAPRAAAPR